MLLTEIKDLLKAYLMGWKTIRDCAEWLSGIDWDDPNLDSESQRAAGLLELLSTEILEGLRSEADFLQAASELIANEETSLYIQPVLNNERYRTTSSSDNTERTPKSTTTGVEASKSWNMSPLLEPA